MCCRITGKGESDFIVFSEEAKFKRFHHDIKKCLCAFFMKIVDRHCLFIGKLTLMASFCRFEINMIIFIVAHTINPDFKKLKLIAVIIHHAPKYFLQGCILVDLEKPHSHHPRGPNSVVINNAPFSKTFAASVFYFPLNSSVLTLLYTRAFPLFSLSPRRAHHGLYLRRGESREKRKNGFSSCIFSLLSLSPTVRGGKKIHSFFFRLIYRFVISIGAEPRSIGLVLQRTKILLGLMNVTLWEEKSWFGFKENSFLYNFRVTLSI